MRTVVAVFLVTLLAVFCSSAVFAQSKDKPFPTDDEINLAVTQADRAMEQYKLTVTQEEAVK